MSFDGPPGDEQRIRLLFFVPAVRVQEIRFYGTDFFYGFHRSESDGLSASS